MRGLAEAYAAAGFAVELPRLPGHGTSVEDMLTTSWADWSAAAEAAYEDLAGRCEKVVVSGLSMGGTLTTWLATRHPEIAGVVLINAAVAGDGGAMVAALDAALADGTTIMPAVGNDIAKDGVTELAYDAVPVAGLRSLAAAIDEMQPDLAKIECPVLVMSAPDDHVVPAAASDHVAGAVSGPVERLTLARSFHVATLDHDAELIEQEAVAFARRVTA